ncbi:MAG TPA: glycosyltransferase [Verrucomicrobiae bacterium]|nr:glycosyltransferase [Verrucomicrobiae bacterium]
MERASWEVTAPSKILLVVTGLGVGGAEWQVVALAHRFQALGSKVAVVTLIEPGRLKEEFVRVGIPVESLGMKRGLPGPGALLKLARIVKRENPDVVHSHMFHANIVGRVSRTMWRNVPLVCTIHNVNEVSASSTKWNKKTWRDDAYRWTNGLASRTTAICDTATKRYVDVGAFRNGQIETVVNGIVVSKFARDAVAGAKLRKELGLENKIVGLMVARMEPPKDQALLLRAWAGAVAKHPNLQLVLVGDGPARAELENLAAELKIASNVSFMGIRKDVSAFMSMADFFLLITIMEGLPLVILEAAAASLPAVASITGGIPEAVRDGETGFLVPPGDLEKLTEAILKMAALPASERAAMGTKAHAAIAKRFDLDLIVERWLQIYAEVKKK